MGSRHRRARGGGAAFGVVVTAAALAACHSAGPYGHAVAYAPFDEEARLASGARDYDPVMSQRQPEEWRQGEVTLFGVVVSRKPGPKGQAAVKLSVRRLEPRNLCENANDEDSCRVTVSDVEFGALHAVLTLRPEDDVGPRSVGVGSLVRVVGKLGEDMDPDDGDQVVHARYYRHWPRNTYVTRQSAEHMRQ
jgi:hypothetical protein